MKTLFKIPVKPRKKRKPLKKTQQWICKRCKGSVHDNEGAYCIRHDLCMEFHDGNVYLAKDGSKRTCDGEE